MEHGFLGGLPPETAGVHRQSGPLVLGALEVFLHQLGGDADHVLPLPVLDHVEGLQGADDVGLCDARHLAKGGIRECGKTKWVH